MLQGDDDIVMLDHGTKDHTISETHSNRLAADAVIPGHKTGLCGRNIHINQIPQPLNQVSIM